MSSQTATFASLRAKTDRELADIVGRQLERGLRSEHRAEAEQAFHEAALLLPTIYGLSAPERFGLELKLDQLRQQVRRHAAAGGAAA